MNEREMREIIRQLCDDLDTRTALEKARRTGKMVFIRTVLGASVGLSACSPVALYAAPDGDVVVTDAVGDGSDIAPDNMVMPLYSAPLDVVDAPADATADIAPEQPVVLYGVPFDSGPDTSAPDGAVPLYSAPNDP